MILLDISGLLAALDESQHRHPQCRQALAAASAPLLLSPFVLAELDYMLMRHIGAHAQTALFEDVARGAYRLESFDAEDIARAGAVMSRFADLQIGLADASLVVLAERHNVSKVLTLDARHFSALRIGARRRFTLLPGDRY